MSDNNKYDTMPFPFDSPSPLPIESDGLKVGLRDYFAGQALASMDTDERTRDDVARAGATVEVADLPGRGREMLVALVPDRRDELVQGRCQHVDGIARQVRVGDMALDALDGELAAHGAAASVLDHVAGLRHRGRLADDAVVDLVAARLEFAADHHRPVVRRALALGCSALLKKAQHAIPAAPSSLKPIT